MEQYRPKQFFKEFENIYGDIQKEEVSPYEALKPEYDTTGYSKLFNKEKTQCEESSDPAWREILRSSLYLGAYLEEELSRNANNVMTKEMIQAVHLALYNGSYEGWAILQLNLFYLKLGKEVKNLPIYTMDKNQKCPSWLNWSEQ